MSRPLGILILFILLFAIFLPACETTGKVRERELRIRYVSVGILFEFVVKQDTDARSIKKEKNSLMQQREKLLADIRFLNDRSKREILTSQLQELELRMKEFSRKEDRHKIRIFKIIDRALVRVAKRMGLDYILNSGDTVLYSRKEYDVTDDVVQEILRLQKRNAPVSR